MQLSKPVHCVCAHLLSNVRLVFHKNSWQQEPLFFLEQEAGYFWCEFGHCLQVAHVHVITHFQTALKCFHAVTASFFSYHSNFTLFLRACVGGAGVAVAGLLVGQHLRSAELLVLKLFELVGVGHACRLGVV